MFRRETTIREQAAPGETTRQPSAPIQPMARTAITPAGRSGGQATSSVQRTTPSLIGSTTALTRKPNLQRRTLIGGLS